MYTCVMITLITEKMGSKSLETLDFDADEECRIEVKEELEVSLSSGEVKHRDIGLELNYVPLINLGTYIFFPYIHRI